jgi:hypothetical protein
VIFLLALMAIDLAVQAAPTPPAAPPVRAPAAPLPPPSAEAMAIAATLVSMPNVAEWEKRLNDELLRTSLAWRGIGCDETDSRCQAAAAKVAARNAPIAAAAARDQQQWYVASILQNRMSETELQSAAAFMATEQGQGLAKGLEGVINPGRMPNNFYLSMVQALAKQKPWSITTAAEELFETTRDLPRSKRSIVPPPPAPPSPAPK